MPDKRYAGFVWMMLLAFQFLLAGSLEAQQYDIRNSGAIGDGITDNTLFIQKAIDSCTITGGTVYIPKGTYLSGTLNLKSNVTLHLSVNAILLGQPAAKFYPYQDSGIHFYGEDWAKQALIFCKNQKNVAIEGKGTIDGQGAAFVTTTLKKPDRYKNRPYLLWFAGCENVSVTGVQLRNSAFWMQHYLGCKTVRIDGISIWNHSNKNNDMMDIDGCSNVTISNITGDSDDDGITIKSTSPLVSEHIVISNCILSSHCSAIKFGTESVGGFRNIAISNCVIKPSAQTTTIYGKPAGIGGLAMEIVDGGIMEHIVVSNLVIDGPEVPLFLRLGNRARKYIATAEMPKPGIMRDITISDVVATGAAITGCSVSGIAKANVENVSFNNIRIAFAGGGVPADVKRKIEELEDLYPEATMFGKLPAFGFFIRHVKGLRMSGISMSTLAPEQRPAFFVNDTKDFAILDIDTKQAGTSVLVSNSVDGLVSAKSSGKPVEDFLRKDGSSKNIKARLD
ncbi:glycoside hydrolase family 28 protein [Dyadobacter pollutisoli]|uniref:Glycosyl hydrolase family 28 protein n=1 Tax=Dyadobacter pollutisoli TaxID=2910158 RepID=A0A9E8NCA7_9BACT|nr:glycosyl hydrolase family 28 protein [Dyadobacter pollutisoli]WAC13373.1 glycosyl hydrolase family 28 protein [Dyadobacter pollutisoli]